MKAKDKIHIINSDSIMNIQYIEDLCESSLNNFFNEDNKKISKYVTFIYSNNNKNTMFYSKLYQKLSECLKLGLISKNIFENLNDFFLETQKEINDSIFYLIIINTETNKCYLFYLLKKQSLFDVHILKPVNDFIKPEKDFFTKTLKLQNDELIFSSIKLEKGHIVYLPSKDGLIFNNTLNFDSLN